MPIAKKKDIPEDFLNQMKTNLSKPQNDTIEPSVKEQNTQTQQINFSMDNIINSSSEKSTEGKKEKYADVMNVRLSKGRRNEIKAFCTKYGVTVTQYIESSFEFFSREVSAGNIIISKGGISKVEK